MEFSLLGFHLVFLFAAVLSGAKFDHLSPHQWALLDSKLPTPEENCFSFDLPAGPRFSEAEKEAQRELGKSVMPMVMKAFESGAGEVRIPPEISCQAISRSC